MSDLWGYHLIINASGADLEKISSHEHIQAFAKELVKRIDMIPYGEPQTVRFGEGNKCGITLIQLISTSNIMCHFVEDDGRGDGTGSFYMDIFSCKVFDQRDVVECCEEYFGKTRNSVTFLTRHAY
jgi:S-adenosylmethionine/arginine decarboxylase-like enzyme